MNFDINTQRAQLSFHLATRFADETRLMLMYYKPEQQVELCTHLIEMADMMEANPNDERVFKTYMEKEDLLASRYGKAFKAFYDTDYGKYFDDDILIKTGLVEPEGYKELAPEQRNLSEQEQKDFWLITSGLVRKIRREIYLLKEPEFGAYKSPAVQPKADTEEDKPGKQGTRAQLLLSFYYLLKAGFGIEHRSTNYTSTIVHFLHYVMQVDFTTMQKSDLYKKYLRMPNYKQSEIRLIEDLKFIRSKFEPIEEFAPAIKLIDAEIDRAHKELPAQLRRQYRKNEG